MNFAEAMSNLFEGLDVRRLDWNRPSHITIREHVDGMTNPIITLVMKDGVTGPYTPSGCDMVAKDWYVLNEDFVSKDNYPPNKDDLARLNDVDALVEATNIEYLFLWQENEENHKYAWRVLPYGFYQTIGLFARRPVCVSFRFCNINGKKILFYEATSNTVNHEMVTDWLTKYITADSAKRKGTEYLNKTDAMNFFSALR